MVNFYLDNFVKIDLNNDNDKYTHLLKNYMHLYKSNRIIIVGFSENPTTQEEQKAIAEQITKNDFIHRAK
jgi:hypothetical protein